MSAREKDTASERGAFQKLLVELSLLIAGTLLISSVITPSLYVWVRSLWPEIPWPYSRVFDRVIMVVALSIFVLRRKHFQVKHYKEQLSIHLAKPRLIPVVIGFFVTFLLSLSVVPLLVAGGTLQWSENSFGQVALRLLKVAPAALLISIIEEVFFRFFLFRSLRQYLSFGVAAVLTSTFYSVVHFIQPVKTWEFTNLEFSTGFTYLGLLIGRLAEPGFVPAAFGLFLVGLVLCATIERTRSLLPVIGLHAGWVATVKVVGKLCDAAPGFEYPAGAGRRYYLLTEEYSWFAIVLVWLATLLLFRKVRN
ncbi:MAG: type II CAAX prenyl endopeptidase Rce1 family protein [Bdellovibrionota bacterium]